MKPVGGQLLLLDLTAIALLEQPSLEKYSGRVSDSGEATLDDSRGDRIVSTVPAPVLTASLYERFSSRGEDDFADKLLSAMRFQFGGHLEKAAGAKCKSWEKSERQIGRKHD